jgi:hypothetical protein
METSQTTASQRWRKTREYLESFDASRLGVDPH